MKLGITPHCFGFHWRGNSTYYKHLIKVLDLLVLVLDWKSTVREHTKSALPSAVEKHPKCLVVGSVCLDRTERLSVMFTSGCWLLS